MPRPVSLLPALVAAVLTGLGVGSLSAPATASATSPTSATAASTVQAASVAAAPEEVGPLTMTIDAMTPSTLPRRGAVRLTGTITNVSEETWSTVNLYPIVSDDPMTTTAQLDAGAEVPAEVFVGERITDPGPYDVLDELAPGETAQYSFSVPRRRIAAQSAGVAAGSAGVYWFGVHALGESGTGRDDVADGRARTFLPLVAETSRTLDTALVLPVRRDIVHQADGRLGAVSRWARTLAPTGQLRRLVELGAASGDRAVTWLVDPAVTAAAERLARGNPARSLGPTTAAPGDGAEGDGDESESTDPTPSADPSAESESADPEATPEEAEQTRAAATAAAAWLDRLQEAVSDDEVLSLPYGDVDSSAAASHDPAVYQVARERAGDRLRQVDHPTSPAMASPTGYLSPAAIELADPDTTVLVSDRALREGGGTTPTVLRVSGRTVVVTSSGAASGGPGPDDRLAPVAVRQRLLSEAALRLGEPRRRPLVTVLPATWNPKSTIGFFEGLDVDWLNLTTVEAIARRSAATASPDRLVYPAAEQRAELDATDFAASTALTAAGDTLETLLTLNDEVGGQVLDEALTDISYANRRFPMRGRASATRSQEWIDERLQSVTVEGPRAVILSSGSGRFSATIRNGLDEPVTVRLAAEPDADLEVTVPDRDVEVAPLARTTILLNAASDAAGVRSVTLVLNDAAGTPLGSRDTLPIRANRVSNVIWLILGTGVALLFGAIVLRLYRRVRAARS